MKCHNCNAETELKVFSSFQYDYCPICKDDISVLKPSEKVSLTPPPSPFALRAACSHPNVFGYTFIANVYHTQCRDCGLVWLRQ